MYSQDVKISSPDYASVEPEEACEDFLTRIDHYKQAYEPLCMAQDKWVYIHVLYTPVTSNMKQQAKTAEDAGIFNW